MCSFCQSEYADPSNRRFHAQTVACPKCGPKAYLTTRKANRSRTKTLYERLASLSQKASSSPLRVMEAFTLQPPQLKDEPLIRLRKAKHRRQKPFAIMARSLEAVNSFAEVSPKEAELLTSYTRPIVLLKKSAIIIFRIWLLRACIMLVLCFPILGCITCFLIMLMTRLLL
jgi:hydrogenase maturation protein HypF